MGLHLVGKPQESFHEEVLLALESEGVVGGTGKRGRILECSSRGGQVAEPGVTSTGGMCQAWDGAHEERGLCFRALAHVGVRIICHLPTLYLNPSPRPLLSIPGPLSLLSCRAPSFHFLPSVACGLARKPPELSVGQTPKLWTSLQCGRHCARS